MSESEIVQTHKHTSTDTSPVVMGIIQVTLDMIYLHGTAQIAREEEYEETIFSPFLKIVQSNIGNILLIRSPSSSTIYFLRFVKIFVESLFVRR